jgi:hypothetical protein
MWYSETVACCSGNSSGRVARSAQDEFTSGDFYKIQVKFVRHADLLRAIDGAMVYGVGVNQLEPNEKWLCFARLLDIKQFVFSQVAEQLIAAVNAQF